MDLTRVLRSALPSQRGLGICDQAVPAHLPLLLAATVEALRRHPGLNAADQSSPSGPRLSPAPGQPGVHLAVVLDTPKGELVPVVRDAGDLSLSGLAKRLQELISQACADPASARGTAGASLVITDHSRTGALVVTAPVRPGQVAALSLGAIVRRPAAVADPGLGEIIAIRDLICLSLSYDPGLVDAAEAAHFLGTIKRQLEAETPTV